MSNNTTEPTETDIALNAFYTNFPYTRLNVQDNFITYKVPFGFAPDIAREANELIERLSLPLTAKTHSTYGIFTDCVLIEPKQ